MSDKHYKVLAIKCRPQTFEDVVGQPHVTRTLQNAIRLKRIAHAYLFTGARGVGKTSVARILAKALNCEKSPGPSPAPCGDCLDANSECCSNCREIAGSNSIDVLEIDGASNRGIDNIRELRETVRYMPAKGRYKVYIIDEVHMLTTEAFNALLKTLEEPPPQVVFIFATTEPHKIPATILSRCQKFDFRRVALSSIVEHLRKITANEGEVRDGEARQAVRFSDTVLYAVAREADGSMRDAQSLLEQLLAFSGDDLPDEEILDILGVIDRRSVLRAGEAIISSNAAECLDLVEEIYRRGIDSRRFCRQLCDHFRNLLLLSITDSREKRLDLPEEEKKLLAGQAAMTTPDSLHVYFQMLLRGEEEIRQSSTPKIALEMLLLRMAQLPRLESLDAVLDRIGELENMLRGEGPGAPAGPRPQPSGGGRPGAQPSGFRGHAAANRAPSSTPAPAARAESTNTGNQTGNTAREPDGRFLSDPLHPKAKDSPGISTTPAPPALSPAAGPCAGPPSRGLEGLETPPPPMGASKPGPPGIGEPPAYIEEFFESPNDFIPPEPDFGAPDLSHPKPASTDPAEVAERWPEFVNFLENYYPIQWAKAAHCSLRVTRKGRLELEVPEIFEPSVNSPEFLERLDEASDAFFGRKYKWDIIRKEAPPKGASVNNHNIAKTSGKQVVNHPAVQQAIEILGAELVEVKPFRPPRAPGSGRKTVQGRQPN